MYERVDRELETNGTENCQGHRDHKGESKCTFPSCLRTAQTLAICGKILLHDNFEGDDEFLQSTRRGGQIKASEKFDL